jgi:hypothetical protein
MYGIAALIVIYGIVVVAFSFARPHHAPADNPPAEKK